MREEWSSDDSAVKIYGDVSPWPVIAKSDVVAHFGSVEETFHGIHRLWVEDMLPRPNANESRPFSMRDIELAEENRERGYRHWRFGSFGPPLRHRGSSYDKVWGYYYEENGYAVFPDINERIKLV
jgi:hypothetical protein